VCVCGVARDTKKSPHVRTATNESEEELVTRGIFFSFPLNPKPQNPTQKNSSRKPKHNKHQHATTMRDDEHD
jgi:hypothetical protein